MATLAEVETKLRSIEREVADLRARIDRLDPSASPPEVSSGWPTEIKFADKEPLRKTFDELFTRMGISHVHPIGAEQLQEMMRKEGVKAEDNIFSRGIIEMREE